MLVDSQVIANIPASDLQRARDWYADKAGLTPTSENETGLTYETTAGSAFVIYETQYAGTAGHTLAQWHVSDIEAEVRALKDKGVAFEQYELPGVEWSDGIATAPFGRAAWFKDSEGNILCIDQLA
ncbi:MAG: VOC family protein [Propionibacteriales bacterium]|nr:VOC family protein [Propionibacteriales bacterium]